jgi:putative endonuclease
MEPVPTYPPHRLGRRGEDAAATFLKDRGWIILARNYRFGRREVDLVIRRGGVLAFVEVKTRAGEGFGAPEAAITRLKRREIEIVAAQYLIRFPPGDVDIRFDAVAVRRTDRRGGFQIEHLEDAWRPDWP